MGYSSSASAGRSERDTEKGSSWRGVSRCTNKNQFGGSTGDVPEHFLHLLRGHLQSTPGAEDEDDHTGQGNGKAKYKMPILHAMISTVDTLKYVRHSTNEIVSTLDVEVLHKVLYKRYKATRI